MDLWGGHPGTANRRVTLNGRTTYPLARPDRRTLHARLSGHPTEADGPGPGPQRGAVRLRSGNDILGSLHRRSGLPAGRAAGDACGPQAGWTGSFRAAVRRSPSRANPEAMKLSLDVPAADCRPRSPPSIFRAATKAMTKTATGRRHDWHGFTKARQPVAYLGTATPAAVRGGLGFDDASCSGRHRGAGGGPFARRREFALHHAAAGPAAHARPVGG